MTPKWPLNYPQMTPPDPYMTFSWPLCDPIRPQDDPTRPPNHPYMTPKLPPNDPTWPLYDPQLPYMTSRWLPTDPIWHQMTPGWLPDNPCFVPLERPHMMLFFRIKNSQNFLRKKNKKNKKTSLPRGSPRPTTWLWFIFTDIRVVWRHFRSEMVRSRLVPGSFRKKTYKGLCVRVFSLFWKNAGNLPFFWIWTSTIISEWKDLYSILVHCVQHPIAGDWVNK